jgi:hypothetical protein
VDLETFERNSDFVIFRLRRVNENEGVCHGRI